MEELFKPITDFCSQISIDQVSSFMVSVIAFTMAAQIAKKAVTIVLSTVGALALLYFFKPDLYSQVLGWIIHLCNIGREI